MRRRAGRTGQRTGSGPGASRGAETGIDGRTPTFLIAVATLIRFSGSGPWVAMLISAQRLAFYFANARFSSFYHHFAALTGPGSQRLASQRLLPNSE